MNDGCLHRPENPRLLGEDDWEEEERPITAALATGLFTAAYLLTNWARLGVILLLAGVAVLLSCMANGVAQTMVGCAALGLGFLLWRGVVEPKGRTAMPDPRCYELDDLREDQEDSAVPVFTTIVKVAVIALAIIVISAIAGVYLLAR